MTATNDKPATVTKLDALIAVLTGAGFEQVSASSRIYARPDGAEARITQGAGGGYHWHLTRRGRESEGSAASTLAKALSK